MGSTPSGRQGGNQPHNIAAAIAEVSDRATLLVREEIELAKAEVTEKATKLIKGAVVGAVAGIFFLTALVFALVGCAWLLYYFLPGGDFTYFWGFFAMAAILVVLGVLAGLVAARAVKRGSPPVPNMAIEEARKIRETVSGGPGAAAAPVAELLPDPVPAPEIIPDPMPASTPEIAPDSMPASTPEIAPDPAPAPAAGEGTPEILVEETPEPGSEGAPDPITGAPSPITEHPSDPAADPDGGS